MPEEEGGTHCWVSCQNNHPQCVSSFCGICDAWLKWAEHEMEKAYRYEPKEGEIRWETARQKHIVSLKFRVSMSFFGIQWFLSGTFLGILQTILNSDTSIRELPVIRSSYLAQAHDQFQPDYGKDRASCISNAEESKGDASKILPLSRVSHTTFSNEHRIILISSLITLFASDALGAY